MKETTLCYVQKDNKYLMLHRIKKEEDVNEGKWIGIGGRIEDGETPEQCLVREAMEETGLNLTSYQYRGIVHFRSQDYEDEDMHLFTADAFEANGTGKGLVHNGAHDSGDVVHHHKGNEGIK